MKKIFLLFYVMCGTIPLMSQAWQLTWQQCFGGSKSDWARDITYYNGGYYIIGTTFQQTEIFLIFMVGQMMYG
jgi:beta-xylosidase